ncbi:MAG: EthD family reductase [Candidatus Melainabacteria bacterium]|nr:EthD family reductase [Candidatus Melainabacteria bacterium]
MVKLIALYKNPVTPQEFDQQYFQDHIPLASKMPGLRKIEVSRVFGAPQGEAEYYLVAELYFDDMDALKAAMTSPEGKAAAKNLMGFAKDLVTMMFAQVEEKIPTCTCS